MICCDVDGFIAGVVFRVTPVAIPQWLATNRGDRYH